MKRPSTVVALLFGMLSLACILPKATCVAQTPANPNSFERYVGIYKSKTNAFVSIAKFDLGDGQNRMLFTDFGSGIIRVLSPESEDRFTAGTGLLVNPPVEMQISFATNVRSKVTSLVWKQPGAADRVADRVILGREEISFRNGEVTLSGTLITPDPGRSHPAVVLLHGSGALNRYSFGPFPDFFLSQGYAVLVYDKRGTGSSSGNLERSTFNDLASDGGAAVRFLKGHKGIDAHRIGLFGSSQGGFLAALVASRNRDVAFIINLYGMYVPAWQQELYRAEAEMREGGLSETERAAALAFMNLEFDVARTGEGWEKLASEMRQAKNKKWMDYVPKGSSANELRQDWRTIYSYDPALALQRVSCPVLALFGSLDNSTPVAQTIANMQRALKIAGNPNFRYRVFAKGNHGLLESEMGYNSEIPKLKRFVPGLFETMTTWLSRRKSVPGGMIWKHNKSLVRIGRIARL
jgi:pimeloyl-ACP methyl ester carboxylesterase